MIWNFNKNLELTEKINLVWSVKKPLKYFEWGNSMLQSLLHSISFYLIRQRHKKNFFWETIIGNCDSSNEEILRIVQRDKPAKKCNIFMMSLAF